MYWLSQDAKRYSKRCYRTCPNITEINIRCHSIVPKMSINFNRYWCVTNLRNTTSTIRSKYLFYFRIIWEYININNLTSYRYLYKLNSIIYLIYYECLKSNSEFTVTLVSWSSWLSHSSNTLKVFGSSPGDANCSIFFFFRMNSVLMQVEEENWKTFAQ